MLMIKGLTKDYGRVRVLDNVCLEADASAPVVILGPSGSGKTTLLRLIAGLELPERGEIELGGTVVSRPGWALEPHKRKIGFVFQTSALWPHMNVRENILFGLHGLPKNAARERLRELLERTGLESLERRYPDELSGGEARRVAVARCLASKPKMLLMDEPLTNLDAALKEEILTLILDEARANQSLLVYVTHEISETLKISGRIFLLKEGRLEQETTPLGKTESL